MNFETSKDYQQNVSTPYYLFLLLPMMAFIWVYMEQKHRDLAPALSEAWIGLVGALLGLVIIALIVFAFLYFKKQVELLRANNSLRDKLKQLYPLYLKFYALLFAALSISVFAYYLTQLWYTGFAFMALVLLFSYHRPTPYKFCKDLRLPAAEKEIVMNFYAIR